MSPKEEQRALAFDPWAGDMDNDSVTIRDAFVTTRKPASCAICFGSILVGERVRAQTQRSEEQRKVMTFKFCPACCEGMASDHADYSERMAKRYALGMRRAAQFQTRPVS